MHVNVKSCNLFVQWSVYHAYFVQAIIDENLKKKIKKILFENSQKWHENRVWNVWIVSTTKADRKNNFHMEAMLGVQRTLYTVHYTRHMHQLQQANKPNSQFLHCGYATNKKMKRRFH